VGFCAFGCGWVRFVLLLLLLLLLFAAGLDFSLLGEVPSELPARLSRSSRRFLSFLPVTKHV